MIERIKRAVDSSISLRNKKDLIVQFIQSLEMRPKIDEELERHHKDSKFQIIDKEWDNYLRQKMPEELDAIIKSENLNPEATYRFMQDALLSGYIPSTGTDLNSILPPVSRFTPNGERTQKKQIVFEKLVNFLERYFDLSKQNLTIPNKE